MAIYKIKYNRVKLSDVTPEPICNAANAVEYLESNCFNKGEMWRESVYAVFFNQRNLPIGHILVAMGGCENTPLDKKIIVKGALDSFASGVILSHNHPSGDCRPSSSDITQTKKIKDALAIFDITLLDHVIIGENEFYSFADDKVTVKSKN